MKMKRDPFTGWSEKRAAREYQRDAKAEERGYDRVRAAQQRLARAKEMPRVAIAARRASAAALNRAARAGER